MFEKIAKEARHRFGLPRIRKFPYMKEFDRINDYLEKNVRAKFELFQGLAIFSKSQYYLTTF